MNSESVTSHAERIAAATRIDDTGRNRYHGRQKRGRPSEQQDDRDDVRHAMKELEKALGRLREVEAAIAAIPAPSVRREEQRLRREAKRHMVERTRFALRFIDGILERHGIAV